jgi:hypothetical protein
MSVNMFLLDDNKQMVWGLIQDEFTLKDHSPETVQRIRDVFNTNIRGFFEYEKTKTDDLFDLNKKYILTMLGYINNNILRPKQKTEVVEDKYYTHEDIQNDRRSQFDKELNMKQNEFTSAVTPKIPPVPNFSDNVDEPIVEMEEAVRKMVEQRKYEIDQLSFENPLLEKVEEKGGLRGFPSGPVVEPKSIRGVPLPKGAAEGGGTAPVVDQKGKGGVPLPKGAAEGGGTAPVVDQKGKRGVYGGTAPVVDQKGKGGVSAPVYIKIDKENIVDNTIYKNEVIDLEPRKQITWSSDIIEQNIFNKLKPIKPETSNSFQQEFDELKIKMELMNANTNKILELLTILLEKDDKKNF